MEFEIDLQRLADACMSPNLYCYLVCLHKGMPLTPNIYYTEEEMKWAEEQGYIKGYIAKTNIVIRPLFLKLAKIDKRAEDINNWIKEWCDLFPDNLKNGAGMPVKSDVQTCARKMLWFFKEYKQYTKEDIFEVTKMYLMERKKKNYEYLITSEYFIHKDKKSSPMANLLADSNAREAWKKNQEGGGSSFHTQI